MWSVAPVLALLLAALQTTSARADGAKVASAWVAATPDAMVAGALERARAGGPDALGGLLIAAALDERASAGLVRRGLAEIGRAGGPLAGDARWLGLALTPSAPVDWPGASKIDYVAPTDADGLVRGWAILGPFQDTDGGGLLRAEGPEAEGRSFADDKTHYAWGTYDVAWRKVAPSASTARGVPLDLYVSPRTESCTYLASLLKFPSVGRVVAHVAASGSVRLIYDGATLASGADSMPEARLDRLSVALTPSAGPHLFALKVCASSTDDDGRARLRFTDEAGKPVRVSSSSDLTKYVSPAGSPLAEAKPTRIPTALERALALSDSSSDADLLVASLARTLGGGENARSPRAPGMLDSLARSRATSPDVLALAGWISPFGANRSGWLNLARARAAEAGQTATEDFTLRRLAAAQLESRNIDWARATSRRDPLASATDAEAKLLRATLQGADGSSFNQVALHSFTALSKELGARAPAALWQAIAASPAADAPARAQAVSRLAELTPEAIGPEEARLLGGAGRTELLAAVRRAVLEQTRGEDVVALAELAHQAGDEQLAYDIYRYATYVGPNLAPAFRGLASARQAALAKAGVKPSAEDAAEAAAALERALDLTPGDPSLKAELAFRSPPADEAEGELVKMRDERFIVPASVFLDRAKANPVRGAEIVDRQLHWARVVTFHDDRRVSQLMHYAREIVVEPRTEDELMEAQIPLEGARTDLLFARVHRVDGSIAEPAEQSNDGQSPFIRWPELHKGDVVEVAVRSWTAGPIGRRGDAPFYFIDYVGSLETHPILYNEVVVDSPDNAPLAIDVLHGKPDRVAKQAERGRTITQYIWDNPPSVRDEPLAPAPTESLPVVVGSTFKTWGDFRDWYRSAIAGFTEPDDQIRRLAAELTRGKTTRDAKLEALFDFVADDIRYVNYVSGEWWLPNRPQQLLARRQGDCDDKAMLLISLLKAVGIEATEVLVQTRYTAQPSVLESPNVAIPMFDHGIAYLPGERGAPGRYLDATSPQSRLGPLPSMDSRARALFINDGPATIQVTPPSSPSEHGTTADWTIALDPSGAGDLRAVERHTGDAAFALRSNLQQKDARAQWVEQSLSNGWFPTVQVSGDIDFKSDLPNGVAELRYQAHSEGFARREGGELAVPISQTMTLTSRLASLSERTLPVVLPPGLAPSHDEVTFTLVAPPGFTVADLPPGGVEDAGSFGRSELSFSRAPGKRNTVIVTRRIVFDMSKISVADYPRWRAWLQRTDGLMHRMVRFVPNSKAPAISANK